MDNNNSNLKREEDFHDNWAKTINLDDLCVYQAFEGPVSPEYHFAVRLLGHLKGKKILNPGCGAGEEAVYLAKKGVNVYAIDISSEMLKLSAKLAKHFKLKKGITFHKMNAEDLNFPDEYFNLIFGNSILHHIDIEKASQEFKRILKKGGKAVFIEPLFYNPVINLYRSLAKQVRTADEHPLKRQDIRIFKKHFRQVNHYEFHFFTLLIFCYFFIFEGISPNKDRYWKRIIRYGKRYAGAFNILYFFDRMILTIFPPLRWLCWATVIEAIK